MLKKLVLSIVILGWSSLVFAQGLVCKGVVAPYGDPHVKLLQFHLKTSYPLKTKLLGKFEVAELNPVNGVDVQGEDLLLVLITDSIYLDKVEFNVYKGLKKVGQAFLARGQILLQLQNVQVLGDKYLELSVPLACSVVK